MVKELVEKLLVLSNIRLKRNEQPALSPCLRSIHLVTRTERAKWANEPLMKPRRHEHSPYVA